VADEDGLSAIANEKTFRLDHIRAISLFLTGGYRSDVTLNVIEYVSGGDQHEIDEGARFIGLADYKSGSRLTLSFFFGAWTYYLEGRFHKNCIQLENLRCHRSSFGCCNSCHNENGPGNPPH
jgi:hypothetical protein